MRKAAGGLAAIAGLSLVAAFWHPPTAEAVKVKNFKVQVFCTAPLSQTCNPAAVHGFTTKQSGTVRVRFVSNSPGVCSSFRVTVSIDGGTALTSGFVGPHGKTAPLPFSLSAGPHQLSIQAEGEVGGCNVGELFSWGGTVRINQ